MMGALKLSKLIVLALSINLLVGVLLSYGDQKTAEDYVNQGKLYYKDKNYDKAIESYNEAIKLNIKMEKAYLNRGNAFLLKSFYEFAISDYSKIIEFAPNNGKAYNNRAIAYWLKGDYVKAREDIKKAQSLGIAITEEKLKAAMPIP